MTQTAGNKTKRAYSTMAVATVVLAGLLVALVVAPQEVSATFPGDNGRIAFASNRATGEGVNNPEGDFEIFAMESDGTDLVQLTHNASFDFDPEWSPDGTKIAFESDRDLFSDIFVMNADGTNQTNVTNNRAFDRSPTFARDGERIAFSSNLSEGVDNPSGDTEIFSVNLEGSGPIQLTNNTARDFFPDFKPNGKKIAFVSDRDFAPGIYTMNANGTEQEKVSRGSGTVFASPSYSPYGKRIAFMSNQEGGDDVYVMRANGSGQERLIVNGFPTDSGPVFSPDGKEIAFQTNRDGNFEIYTMNRDGAAQTNLTNDPAGDLTPDWQRLQGHD